MGQDPSLEIDLAALDPAHRDTPLMGPGDNSDSGADSMGLDGPDDADPSLRPGNTPEEEDEDLAFVDDRQAGDLLQDTDADEVRLSEEEDETEDEADRPGPARDAAP